MEDHLESNLYIEIGKLIKKARIYRDLTQQELSDSTKLARASVANIERGTQKVSIFILYQIAEALNVTPQSLLPDKEELNKKQTNLYVNFEDLQEQLSLEEYEWVNQLKKKVENRERDDDGNKKLD